MEGELHTICMGQFKLVGLTDEFTYGDLMRESLRNHALYSNMIRLSDPFVISCSDDDGVLNMYRQKYRRIAFYIEKVEGTCRETA